MRLVLCGVALAATPAAAQADLVFFASGRSLSVRSHHFENGALVLALRGGGQIICDPALVARIAPDEVPYAEPATEAAVPDSGGSGQVQASDRAAPPRVRPADRTAAAGRYAAAIHRAASAHGVDPKLVRAVIQVESAYRPRARSPRGAVGLMQLMPATARQYGVEDPYDPLANIDAGVRHLRSLLDRFPLRLALAAYNAGEAAVARFGGIPPFAETRAYVTRVLRLLQAD
jgi:soluble lytic murein transglycosylase-like protein